MNIKAALGPTNTGKTHYAIERMVSYKSGIIGLPLRLLTREVFDKVSKEVGPSRVAMITGEERIIPQNPKYWICTVESMPTNIPVEFVGLDEVQLINDPERGHIFTEKLLRLRGMHETLFMGSNTAEKIIRKIIPKVEFINKPRFSKLTYTGYKKISNLPRRTAVIAFSTDSVYSIAEIIRKNKGGVAIIMGSLSPGTRNAQVKMYQEGEVDYIVATDAIGMGLNLDLNHVVFAENRKFDGKSFRNLNPHELGQIAGRAGRYKKNGTFGVTADIPELEIKSVVSIENNEFDKIIYAFWRNNNLNFDSLESLVNSLELKSENYALRNTPITEDFKSLLKLSENTKISSSFSSKNNIKLFWELCQIPNFRQNNEIYHLNIIENLYLSLIKKGKLNDESMEKYTKKLNTTFNDNIHSLSNKLAEIRTWAFISNKKDWVLNFDFWQKKSMEIENNLSDALHEALTERFVDSNSKRFQRDFIDENNILSGVNKNGEITINGNYFGKIEGLKFIEDLGTQKKIEKKVKNLLRKTALKEIKKRISSYITSESYDFSIDRTLSVSINNEVIAKIKKGKDILFPEVILLIENEIDNSLVKKLEEKITIYLKKNIKDQLNDLIKLKDSINLGKEERGLAYRIIEDLGIINRKEVEQEIKDLNPESRRKLKKYGVKIGKYSVYISQVIKPKYSSILPALWLNYYKSNLTTDDIKEQINLLPKAGITSCEINKKVFPELYKYSGYKIIKKYAIRIDILERLDKIIYENIKINTNKNQFAITDEMVSILGTSLSQMKGILNGLGYIIKKDDKNIKNIIWLADLKRTRTLYSQKKSRKVKITNNNIFSDSDLIKLKEKFDSK